MQISHLLEILCHCITPPDPQLFGGGGPGVTQPAQSTIHFSVFVRTVGMRYILILTHTGFGWHSRVLQMLRATYSILQMWFPGHECFFFSVPLECCFLGDTPSSDPGPFLSLPWLPSICAIEQRNDLCPYLWNIAATFTRMKRALLYLTPGCFDLTRYLFLNKYFSSVLGSITSSWSCIKQHHPQSRLVSLFGQLWDVWADIPPKCLTWLSSCLLGVQGTHFPLQTGHRFLTLCHLSVSRLCVIICQKDDIPLVFRTLSAILVFLREEKETPQPISITLLCMRPWENDWAQKGKLRSNVSKQREGLMNIEYWVIFKNCLPSSREKTGRYIRGNWE